MCPSFPPQGFTIKNFLERFNPAIGYPVKGGWIGDFFLRETLTPTGWPTIYTEANVGGGSGVMNADGYYLLTTTALAGDDVDLRLSGINFGILDAMLANSIRGLGLVLDYYTSFLIPTTTLVEGFVGFMGRNFTALAALPTTARHIGIYWDISVGPNFILTSGNDAAQATTNTNIAVDNASHFLHIRWTGSNAATAELMTFAQIPQGATHTTTDLGTTGNMTPHWFVQGETAARTLRVVNWIARIQ